VTRRSIGQARRGRPGEPPSGIGQGRAALGPRSASRLGFGAVLLIVVIGLGWPTAHSGVTPASRSTEAATEGAGHGTSASEEMAGRGHDGALVGHGGPVKTVRVEPGGARALTGSFDYAMTLWDLTGAAPRPIRRLEDHDGAVNAVAFVPGADRALAAGDDGALALWSLTEGRLLHRFTGHTARVVGVAVSADGRWAATAGWDRTARLWDLRDLKPGPVLAEHKAPVNAVAFSADGTRLYTASSDGILAVHAVADGAQQRVLYKHGWSFNVLERLPDSERLVVGALNGAAKVVDGATGQVIAELAAHDRPVLSLAIVEKPGLIATGSADGVIRVTRIGDWSLVETHQNPRGPVWALSFLAGGTQLYYAGLDDFVTRWQIAPRSPAGPIEAPPARRFQVTGSAGDRLAQGELQFARKCSVCHTLEKDGRNRAGPSLHGLFGRRAGTLPGYPYSEALRATDIVWTEETVEKLFELGPEIYTPGSKMPLQRMTDDSQREALVAYLKEASESAGGPTHDGSAPAQR
jgi:cytochrome c